MTIFKRLKLHHFLYTLAILGIILYALSPLLFPDAPGLRQPELLPVYMTMLGLGQIAKGNTKIGGILGANQNGDKDEATKSP